MKKLASIFLSLVFVFSFAACGNSTSSSQSSSASNTQQSAQRSRAMMLKKYELQAKGEHFILGVDEYF